MRKLNKKGIALNQAFGAVLTLVLVAVLVIVGILLFSQLNTAFAGTLDDSVNSESLTPTGVGAFVVAAPNCSFGEFVIVTSTNTSGTLMNAANYTTTAAGLVQNTSLLVEESIAPWVLNYTYSWGSEACRAGEVTITQFGTYPVLIGLVGTIIFLGLVIGVLVASFVFGRRDSV